MNKIEKCMFFINVTILVNKESIHMLFYMIALSEGLGNHAG